MALLFWVSAALLAYVYVGYPLLLRVWARYRPAPPIVTAGRAAGAPGVSIVMATHNEGGRLAARLENLQSLDYPPARRQIIVVSDGSTDNTADVLARYAGIVEDVEIPRSGKAAALNAGVARAKFDILVFADARQRFAPDALRELTVPFADPSIGAVSGELLLDCESALFSNRRAEADRRRGGVGQPHRVGVERRVNGDRRRPATSTIADGLGMYWRYEKELRRLESAVWSMLGATGAIYAMRHGLWQPLPAGTILDDVLAPMRAVLAGRRVVFNEAARALDWAATDADAESRRKIRTLAGNYQILWLEPRLLVPWRNPVWFQYVSHKIGRLAAPYALLGAFTGSVALADVHPVYAAALAVQVTMYLLAGYGAILEFRGRAGRAGDPVVQELAAAREGVS